MNWYVYVILGTLFSALAAISQRKLLAPVKRKKVDPYAYTIIALFLGSIGLLAYRVASSSYHLPNLFEAWPNVIFNLLVSTTATVLMFEGLRRLQASRFTIISSLSPFATVLAAYVFMGTIPTLAQLVGGLMIVGGILIIYFHKHLWTKHYKRGMYYTLASAILFGITLVNDKQLYNHFNVQDYLPISWFISGLLLFVLKPAKARVFVADIKAKNYLPLCTSIVLMSVAIVLVMQGVKEAANPSVVALLQQTKILITAGLGMLLLHEKDDMGHKIIASSLAFGGALLVCIS